MDNPKIIKSKINISMIVLLVIGGTIVASCGIYMIANGIDKFTQLVFGASLLFFGIYCIFCLINYDVINVTGKELVIKSLTGKTKKRIPLQEFNSYTEIEKENASFRHDLSHMKWKDLTLLSDNFSYNISSTTYRNYPELRKTLIKGLKRNKNSEQEWKRVNSLKWGYGLVITGFILGGFIFRNGISFSEITSSILLIGILLIPILVGTNMILKNKKASK